MHEHNSYQPDLVYRATGVTTAMVEAMEESLKRDVLREVENGNGRILLHDEVEERPGVFSIIPIWEDVTRGDIMTPRDVYNLVVREGYKVSVRSELRWSMRAERVITGQLRPCRSGMHSQLSSSSNLAYLLSSRRTSRPLCLPLLLNFSNESALASRPTRLQTSSSTVRWAVGVPLLVWSPRVSSRQQHSGCTT